MFLANCQLGWKSSNGNCYFFSTEKLIKPDAKRACFDNFGARLALIANAAENTFLTGQLANTGDSLWIGINDSKAGFEIVYRLPRKLALIL